MIDALKVFRISPFELPRTIDDNWKNRIILEHDKSEVTMRDDRRREGIGEIVTKTIAAMALRAYVLENITVTKVEWLETRNEWIEGNGGLVLPDHDELLVPIFQINDQLRPKNKVTTISKELIKQDQKYQDPWNIAQWWITPNNMLFGDLPLERIDDLVQSHGSVFPEAEH